MSTLHNDPVKQALFLEKQMGKLRVREGWGSLNVIKTVSGPLSRWCIPPSPTPPQLSRP